MRQVLRAAPAVEHFGELIRPGKYGHRLTREMYALVNKRSSTRIPEHMLNDELRALLAPHYEDAEMTIHTDEFCRRHREITLENFDLNMAFFAQIPQESFDEALVEMHRKNTPTAASDRLAVPGRGGGRLRAGSGRLPAGLHRPVLGHAQADQSPLARDQAV